VTLTGHVANQATKDAVVQLARSVDGIVSVVDNLVIGGGRTLLDWFLPGRNPNHDPDVIDSAGEELFPAPTTATMVVPLTVSFAKLAASIFETPAAARIDAESDASTVSRTACSSSRSRGHGIPTVTVLRQK
jgi:hypothetical protein